MAYEVRVAPSAERAIRKLSARVQDAVLDRLDELAFDPYPAVAEKLQGFPGKDPVYSVPVARSFRIVYQIRHTELVVLVAKVADRKDVYKRLGDLKAILKRNH